MAHGSLAYLLTGIPTRELDALSSKCNDAERRGYPWGAIFWKELEASKRRMTGKPSRNHGCLAQIRHSAKELRSSVHLRPARHFRLIGKRYFDAQNRNPCKGANQPNPDDLADRIMVE